MFVVPMFVAGAFATPASATGDHRFLRIVTTGDAYMVALSSSCPDAYPLPDDPTRPTGVLCYALKTRLAYDGLTGASGEIPGHYGHSFHCGVIGSSTAPAGNALPYPANMAVSDSIMVGFDDGEWVYTYGGRLTRPPLGALVNRITSAVASTDVPYLVESMEWYASGFQVNGATPDVGGIAIGWIFIVWNQGGSDVTVECEF